MGVLTVKNKMGIKKIILKSGIIMNPIKCTNNIINNLLRALKVILKKNYAKIHKYVCIQASSLLLYRVTDRRVKSKNIRVSKKKPQQFIPERKK